MAALASMKSMTSMTGVDAIRVFQVIERVRGGQGTTAKQLKLRELEAIPAQYNYDVVVIYNLDYVLKNFEYFHLIETAFRQQNLPSPLTILYVHDKDDIRKCCLLLPMRTTADANFVNDKLRMERHYRPPVVRKTEPDQPLVLMIDLFHENKKKTANVLNNLMPPVSPSTNAPPPSLGFNRTMSMMPPVKSILHQQSFLNPTAREFQPQLSNWNAAVNRNDECRFPPRRCPTYDQLQSQCSMAVGTPGGRSTEARIFGIGEDDFANVDFSQAANFRCASPSPTRSLNENRATSPVPSAPTDHAYKLQRDGSYTRLPHVPSTSNVGEQPQRAAQHKAAYERSGLLAPPQPQMGIGSPRHLDARTAMRPASPNFATQRSSPYLSSDKVHYNLEKLRKEGIVDPAFPMGCPTTPEVARTMGMDTISPTVNHGFGGRALPFDGPVFEEDVPCLAEYNGNDELEQMRNKVIKEKLVMLEGIGEELDKFYQYLSSKKEPPAVEGGVDTEAMLRKKMYLYNNLRQENLVREMAKVRAEIYELMLGSSVESLQSLKLEDSDDKEESRIGTNSAARHEAKTTPKGRNGRVKVTVTGPSGGGCKRWEALKNKKDE